MVADEIAVLVVLIVFVVTQIADLVEVLIAVF